MKIIKFLVNKIMNIDHYIQQWRNLIIKESNDSNHILNEGKIKDLFKKIFKSEKFNQQQKAIERKKASPQFRKAHPLIEIVEKMNDEFEKINQNDKIKYASALTILKINGEIHECVCVKVFKFDDKEPEQFSGSDINKISEIGFSCGIDPNYVFVPISEITGVFCDKNIL